MENKSIDNKIEKVEKIDKKEEKLSTAQKIENLSNIVSKLADSVSKITEQLSSPESREPETCVIPERIDSTYKPKGYVPPKYRQIVNEILSTEFGFDVIENVDNLDFEIQIIVPERYSSLTALEKQAGMNDIRSKVISRALGENGIRDWCIIVRENLNKFYARSGVVSPFTTH